MFHRFEVGIMATAGDYCNLCLPCVPNTGKRISRLHAPGTPTGYDKSTPQYQGEFVMPERLFHATSDGDLDALSDPVS